MAVIDKQGPKAIKWIEKNLGAEAAEFCRLVVADTLVYREYQTGLLKHLITGDDSALPSTVALGVLDLCISKSLDYHNRQSPVLDDEGNLRLKTLVADATRTANSQNIAAMGGAFEAYSTFLSTAFTDLEVSDNGT